MLKLRSLARRGVDVRVGSFPGAMGSAPEPPGVKVEALPELRGGARAAAGAARDAVGRDPRTAAALLSGWRAGLPVRLWRLYLHLLCAPADVIHIEWLTVATRCLPLLRLWDGPVVISCRGSQLRPASRLSNQARPSALPELFARADAVHVVSEAKRDEAILHGLDPSKATLIRPAVDTDLFCPAVSLRPRAHTFRSSASAWLRWLKGYEYALLAIAELAREGIPVRLDILGGDPPADMDEPSQRARILHTVRDLGLEGRVHLHGHLPPHEVRAHLQRADAFLHASLTEGLPNVVVEAMACGLPAVATDVGGTREALREGVDGFLVPPRDPGAAASALRALWLDPDLRDRLGRAAARAGGGRVHGRATDRSMAGAL